MARRRPILTCVGFCGSKAASAPSRLDADQYRTASDPCWSRMSAGVTTLPFDLDIFLRSGSTMKPLIAALRHGERWSSSVERSMVENSQVRMMSCPCGRRSSGDDEIPQLGVALPAAGELRGQRRGRPGVQDVGLGVEAAGHAALLGRVAGRHVGGRVDRQLRRVGHEHAVVVALAVRVERVPERDRHAEEALPGDQPVAGEPADPVLVAHPHELRVPVQLRAVREQLIAEALVAGAVADVPLPRRDDLERSVALLEELHRVVERLADGGHRTRGLQLLHERLARREHGLAGHVLDVPGGGVRVADRGGGVGQEAAVQADRGHVRQRLARRGAQFAPPHDVGHVAEGADHRRARALVGLTARW